MFIILCILITKKDTTLNNSVISFHEMLLVKSISQLEVEIGNLNESLLLPENCSDYVKIMDIQNLIDEKNSELDKLTQEWFDLSE